MKIPIVDSASLPPSPELTLDAIIGYRPSGSPRGIAADFIRWATKQKNSNSCSRYPSGLDTTTGVAYDPTICATATMTLALPKQGLLNPEVKAHIGELYLADIGVPPEIYLAMGIKVASLFNQEEIIHIA